MGPDSGRSGWRRGGGSGSFSTKEAKGNEVLEHPYPGHLEGWGPPISSNYTMSSDRPSTGTQPHQEREGHGQGPGTPPEDRPWQEAGRGCEAERARKEVEVCGAVSEEALPGLLTPRRPPYGLCQAWDWLGAGCPGQGPSRTCRVPVGGDPAGRGGQGGTPLPGRDSSPCFSWGALQKHPSGGSPSAQLQDQGPDPEI